MAKHDKYLPQSFESAIGHKDKFAGIYLSMLLSENWQKLTKNQQILYIYCKTQLHATKKDSEPLPKPKLKSLQPNELALCFTMNKSKWCDRYHLYKENNHRSFYKDMQALIDNGFIEIVESGRLTRTKSIYKLSSNWHTKKP